MAIGYIMGWLQAFRLGQKQADHDLLLTAVFCKNIHFGHCYRVVCSLTLFR